MYNPASQQIEQIAAEYIASSDPLPLDARHIIGDGDFRAIGSEFLLHLTRLGGLSPQQRVLDVGCGFGRIALPLARYLDRNSQYLGFDIVREPIDWCSNHVSPLHPGFRFAHLDFRHPLYNSSGNAAPYKGFRAALPALEQLAPDFIFGISLFTHLEQSNIEHYLADIGALLPPGGTLFFSAFLTGPATPPTMPGCVFPLANWQPHGYQLQALIGSPLTAAVGIEFNWLQQQLGYNGLHTTQLHFGHWRWGRSQGGSFQDIIVCRKSHDH